jgi:cytochrome c oxidase cbb3-type subunit 3
MIGRRLGIGIAAAACLIAVALGFQYVRHDRMAAALLRADPDMILQNGALAAFAEAMAKPVYDRDCAGCHGAALAGDRARGVPDLADSDWLYGSGTIAEIERTILYGIRSGNPKGWNLAAMPAYATPEPYAKEKIGPLMPPEIRDLVEFLRRLEKQPANAEAAARGAGIFAGKGGCYDCHGNDGSGDSAIGAPDLTDDIWLYGDGSRDSVFYSIAYGHQGACPAWIDRIEPAAIRALAVYIHAVSHPKEGIAARS